jgi:hypothetical protein
MLSGLVKNTLAGADRLPVLPGLVRDTTSGKVVGQLEGFISKTVPAPRVNENVMKSGKAPATKISKSHFGSVQYPGAHS